MRVNTPHPYICVSYARIGSDCIMRLNMFNIAILLIIDNKLNEMSNFHYQYRNQFSGSFRNTNNLSLAVLCVNLYNQVYTGLLLTFNSFHGIRHFLNPTLRAIRCLAIPLFHHFEKLYIFFD